MSELTMSHAAPRCVRQDSGEPFKLVVALTHPIQYYAPWFAFINANCPQVSLDVLYATQPTAAQQGAGFGAEFQWDVALRDGYRSEVIGSDAVRDSVHSDSFFGLDVPALARAVLDREPDVVLVPGWHSISYVRVLRACEGAGIPTIYRGDSNLLSRPRGWKRAAWAVRTRWMLRRYSAYLSVGRRAAEYLRSFDRAEATVFHAPHCVDNDFFATGAAPWRREAERVNARRELGVAPHEFAVLFVGKLEPKKRVRDAVRAVAAAGPEYHLVVAGDGEEQAAAQALARDVGARVTWLGFVNQSSLGRLYALADCLVLPSDPRETWGLVVNEALAAGLPCVVSDNAGCAPDLVVSGATGEQYSCGDTSALVRGLERVRGALATGSITPQTCRALVDGYSFRQATRGLLAACRFVVGHEQESVQPRLS